MLRTLIWNFFWLILKKVDLEIDRTLPVNAAPRLMVKNLNLDDSEGLHVLKDISFTAYGGEILGIAGIAGSGQRELLESITGLQHVQSGEIIFHNPKKNQPVTFFHKQYTI